MKLVKSLLLGSAAGLAAVAGAQAADLPVKKAAPVEYVRICSAYGAGFFYIPGTDTCLRVSGRARFEYQYSEQFTRNGGNVSGYRGLGRMNLDARTQTAYGTLRAFVRFDIASRTGGYLFSGSQLRFANAFRAEGVDTFNVAQKFVDVDKAFIQFAGFTAGKAASFYDFYAHDFELIGSSLGSDVSSTNLLAYTATFGNGFSATISMEDPTFRRAPVFNVGGLVSGALSNFSSFAQQTSGAPVVTPFGVGLVDVSQKNRMPDVVGVLRYDAPWGSAQVSAAVHEISVGNVSASAFNLVPGGTAALVANAIRRPSNEYGWAVQGGVKINTPFIAAGDALYLQGSYGEGALAYTGYTSPPGFDTQTGAIGGRFSISTVDAVLNPFTSRLELSKSFTVVGSYLHYWTPEWRSAFFGSYGEMSLPRNARVNYSIAGLAGLGPITSLAALNSFAFNATLRDTSQVYVGGSLIWSPVRDLDIGVEGVYQRADIRRGRVTDQSLPLASIATVGGVPLRSVRTDDEALIRFRIQRDF